MSNKHYLDLTGLSYFWSKIKEFFNNIIEHVGNSYSNNDLGVVKCKYVISSGSTILTHSSSTLPVKMWVDGVPVTPAHSYTFSSHGYHTVDYIFNDITDIGYATFSSVPRLKAVKLPESLTKISGTNSFYLSGIEEIEIPKGVTSIGAQALSSSSLSKIIARPTTAPTLGSSALNGVATIGTLYYPKGSDYSTWISALPSGWTAQPVDTLAGLTNHELDNTIHVTSNDKTTWDGKQNAIANTSSDLIGLSNDKIILKNSNGDAMTYIASTSDATGSEYWLRGADETHLISSAAIDSVFQRKLTFDKTPTWGSSNPVESGGVYTALDNKQNTIDSSHKLSADLISDGTTNKAYTATEKTKLSGIAAGAEVNIQANWNETNSSSDAYIQNKPTNVSSFTNDAGYLTQHQDISGKEDKSNKVTSISSSSTDTQYPSAKCVYDNVTKAFAKIPYAQVDSTSTSTVFTATIPGITALEDGTCMLLKNGVIGSATDFTININNLGAKPVYSNLGGREATIFGINYTFFFVYSTTRVSGGCWILYRGFYTNDTGIYLRTGGGKRTTKTYCGPYRILFSSPDNTQWIPSTTSTSTVNTDIKDVTTEKINPFGRIIYYSGITAKNAGENISAGNSFDQYPFSFGYSFNKTGDTDAILTADKPVYIKCTPQSDGSAIIDATTPYVQDLPNTEDGKIYIYIGRSYNTTTIELEINKPIYHYKNGAIRLWLGVGTDNTPASGSNNLITSGGVYTALAGKQGTLTFDDTPTQNSTNPVKSSGIYAHTSNSTIHITSSERTAWNGKSTVIFRQW